ncbi:MAG: GNAT family N-acetyltransferase [Saprospiraceae bacterium]|nr:GNAT family N-acetyltransferase [Saprospiraceae bacterium]
MRAIVQPPYTAYSGPWLLYPDEPDMKRPAVYSFEIKTLNNLIRQLPTCAVYRQYLHPTVSNWYPFYWQGYRQSTKYTYILENESILNIDSVLGSSVRKKIKRNKQTVRLFEIDDPGQISAVYRRSTARLGLSIENDEPVFHRLFSALKQRKQGVLLGLREADNPAILAAMAIAFDQRQASFLWSGNAFPAGIKYLNYMLFAECLQWCADRGLAADLEGSMHEGMERVLRSFGGVRTPYFQVSRIRPRILEAGLVLLGKR